MGYHATVMKSRGMQAALSSEKTRRDFVHVGYTALNFLPVTAPLGDCG